MLNGHISKAITTLICRDNAFIIRLYGNEEKIKEDIQYVKRIY